jgi:tetratricopeptide (TPR) repeat protein
VRGGAMGYKWCCVSLLLLLTACARPSIPGIEACYAYFEGNSCEDVSVLTSVEKKSCHQREKYTRLLENFKSSRQYKKIIDLGLQQINYYECAQNKSADYFKSLMMVGSVYNGIKDYEAAISVLGKGVNQWRVLGQRNSSVREAIYYIYFLRAVAFYNLGDSSAASDDLCSVALLNSTPLPDTVFRQYFEDEIINPFKSEFGFLETNCKDGD